MSPGLSMLTDRFPGSWLYDLSQQVVPSRSLREKPLSFVHDNLLVPFAATVQLNDRCKLTLVYNAAEANINFPRMLFSFVSFLLSFQNFSTDELLRRPLQGCSDGILCP